MPIQGRLHHLSQKIHANLSSVILHSLGSSLSCQRFSLEEIESAIDGFRSSTHFGFRGYQHGDAYIGNISAGIPLVIRLYKSLDYTTLMFENEIKALTACHHVNIISIVGFCDEKNEKILVYEFISKGTLYDYIDDFEASFNFTVEQRLEICLGVAKGLYYLHCDTDFNAGHGNITTRNIFLDESLVPKISGIRYVRNRAAGPSSSQQIITNGEDEYYSPPECHEQGYKVSQKTDVYAFGVVLLEVLCVSEPRLLASALSFIMKGELPNSTPEHVKENITPACARQCEILIMNCLESQPEKRPYMNQVVQDLELALKLQKDQDTDFKEQFSNMSYQCQSFSLAEIKKATNELSNILGKGAFGKVYYGKIFANGNNVDVAVKFMSADPERGNPTFDIERKLLSACNHVNVISLVGYCDEGAEKILVYEFMPNGSLFDYLYKHKGGTPRLTLEQRLEVCTSFWTFVCVPCCGIHREFNHRVKSVSISKFTTQEVSALQGGGNASAKEIYFKGWDAQLQSFPDNSDVERLRDFIKHVYVDRRYSGETSFDKPPRAKMSSNASNRYQSFSLVEIKRATNELSNILGQGAFGKVYYGKLFANGNNVDVAVKFMSADPERGNAAFDIERKLLSACNHVNIISLVGYCDEGAEKILVYEFMPNGSLYDYLYKHKSGTPRLTVEQRLEVCTGVAKGLSYLHSRNDYNIIHSDLKTDNILLDANLVPKISDFGLSRTRVVGPSTSEQVTKHIQGTEGYLAPECYEPNYKLSRKADVYAFGVVLLEVLSEKPAWERLVLRALPFVSKGELPNFTPEHVMKNMTRECSRACANLIRDCLEIDPNNRPSTSHVIPNLELALTLQKMNADPNQGRT